jgi:catechol 2,3-dioxygenase-like lactoylglutathione lyase family enzyme
MLWKWESECMELHQIAQHADDLDRAVAFYTGLLGGALIARYDPPGLAFLRLGNARLMLEKAAPSALIYLRVDDVRHSTSQLREAGVTIDSEPHRIHVDHEGVFGEPGVEEWMTFIRDSEGNLVGLASRHAHGHAPGS